MESPRKKGFLRVTQPLSKKYKPDLYFRDFDNEEWSHQWAMRDGCSVLRLIHDNSDVFAETYEFIEFCAPVFVEFISEDE